MKTCFAILPLLALAACSSSPPPVQNFAPLDYSYLKPIVFNAATLNVTDHYVPGPDETSLNANNPAPPGATLLAMLNHRLQPSGAPGTGTVTVQVASITEAGNTLNGNMVVDLNLASTDGRATGFAEASVSASQQAPDPDADPNTVRAALYQMTKTLMTQMNVQLPYQIMHNLPNWVSWSNPQAGGGGAAVTGEAGSIQAAPLAAPPGTGTPAAPGTALPASTNPAVPDYLPGAGPATLSPAP